MRWMINVVEGGDEVDLQKPSEYVVLTCVRLCGLRHVGDTGLGSQLGTERVGGSPVVPCTATPMGENFWLCMSCWWI